MKISTTRDVWLTGMAIFSMYFGAGNFVLPMSLGQKTVSNFHYSALGFILIGILVPAIGLISMLSFQGDYRYFLSTIGKWPGFVLMLITMAFIGPFGALPRCISFSYETLKYHIPYLKINEFSLIVCIIIFIFSIKKSEIITILGRLLTPVLLIALFLIISFALFKAPISSEISCSKTAAFWEGFLKGPQTMDLLASLFFASIILPSFIKILGKKPEQEPVKFFILAAKSCFIGMGLLAIVYCGLTYVSFKYHELLKGVTSGQELAILSNTVLGKYGGFISGIAIILACLTTSVALAVIFSEFIKKEVFKNKVPYWSTLILTMIINLS